MIIKLVCNETSIGLSFFSCQKYLDDIDYSLLEERLHHVFAFCGFKLKDFNYLEISPRKPQSIQYNPQPTQYNRDTTRTNFITLLKLAFFVKMTLSFEASFQLPKGKKLRKQDRHQQKIFVFSEPQSTLDSLISHKQVKCLPDPDCPGLYAVECYPTLDSDITKKACLEEIFPADFFEDLVFLDNIQEPLKYVIRELATALRTSYYFESLDIERASLRRSRWADFETMYDYQAAQKVYPIRRVLDNFFRAEDKNYTSKTVLLPEINLEIKTLDPETGQEESFLLRWDIYFEESFSDFFLEKKGEGLEIKKLKLSASNPTTGSLLARLLDLHMLTKVDFVFC